MWNFDVRIVENFRDVTGEVTSFSPHIILLDITLPFFNGYHWCSEIRKFSRVPIIFISSAADNMNIVMAMNLGADDFVAKPFDLNVLLAKIQALLRRSYDFAPTSNVLAHRGALLDLNDHTLSFNGEDIPLTKNEYRILSCLMEQKGKVISREKLFLPKPFLRNHKHNYRPYSDPVLRSSYQKLLLYGSPDNHIFLTANWSDNFQHPQSYLPLLLSWNRKTFPGSDCDK